MSTVVHWILADPVNYVLNFLGGIVGGAGYTFWVNRRKRQKGGSAG